MYVNLFVEVVQLSVSCQYSHTTILETELVHLQVGRCFWLVEYVCHESPTRGHTAEINGMEIDQIENILHVNILQVGKERISCRIRGTSVDNEVLVLVLKSQMVDSQVVLAIHDGTWLHQPDAVANNDF